MLHEILLSLSNLSGESPLLGAVKKGRSPDNEPLSSLLSPAEVDLVSSLSALSDVHRKVASNASALSSSHPSAICRAIATSIGAVHLARFQATILNVEKAILAKDPGLVGAYDIVPLSGVIVEFEPWTRKLEFLWKMIQIMMSTTQTRTNLAVTAKSNEYTCSGATILDQLRNEIQTGYPEIEEISQSLIRTAETAWLRQLSTWVLYGRLPSFGANDFFIQHANDGSTNGDHAIAYVIDPQKTPGFVTPTTASSILFIGRSIDYVRAKGIDTNVSYSSTSPELALLPNHLKRLSDLSFPVSPVHLSSAIDSIRLSLSVTTLQKLLPPSKIVETLTILRDYFLLGVGEFAVALITEAESQLTSRSRRAGEIEQHTETLDRLTLKDGELKAVLVRTWNALSSEDSPEGSNNTILERARELLVLSFDPSSRKPSRPAESVEIAEGRTMFNDFLVGSAVRLQLKVPPLLDLLLTSELLETYSRIHSYLLSIRRAHLRLTGLWKTSSLRREHPAPIGPPYSCKASGGQLLRTRRARSNGRSKDMRKVWARSSTALFLLAELGDYFQGDILKQSWADLQAWLEGETKAEDRPQPDERLPGLLQKLDMADKDSRPSTRQSKDGTSKQRTPHDPETIARAHNNYLESLVDSLLLNDNLFTQQLRKLLQEIDHLIACVNQLQHIWQNIDLETDEGVMDSLANFDGDQIEATANLELASQGVDNRVRALVRRLRDLDIGRSNAVLEKPKLLQDHEYTPLRPGGVDRLLMKLDFGNLMSHDAEQAFDRVVD